MTFFSIIVAYSPKQANHVDGTATALRNDIAKLTRQQRQLIVAGDQYAEHEVLGNSRRNHNATIRQQDQELKGTTRS